MQDVAADVTRLLVRELASCRREVELFPDDESLWRTVPGVTNAAGNLVLHVCGNLRHFLGAVLGRDGYVRDREAEFGRRSGTRTELAAELDRTTAAVCAALSGISAEALEAAYPEPVLGVTPRLGILLVHFSAHTAYHLGQMGYLRRIVAGDTIASGALSIAPLAESR
jgi:uncharacterized damage-inducible protein DinB